MELNEKGLPFFPELRFEDKRHIYTLGGQLLPSVTTVMKGGKRLWETNR